MRWLLLAGGVGIFIAIALLAYVLLLPPVETPVMTEETLESEPEIVEESKTNPQVVGTSVEGRIITAYSYGDGDTDLLFVGGVHGGYEWNSVVLAYEYINALENGTMAVPDNLSVTIIPTLNPDGLAAVTSVTEEPLTLSDITDPSTRVAAGRFNANDIDLNRNFDCKWEPESTWRGEVVSAGTSAFSEPEARALKAVVEEVSPEAVVFWHSQANNVYASECYDGPLPDTLAIMSAYADAAGYGAVPVFDAYPITGDAEGWLASIGIPAITVELKSFDSIEWSQNKAGIEALYSYYGNTENLAR